MKELINKIGTFCINRLAELVGMSIILASIFTFISLTTYSPEDPNFIFPENTQIKNFMGSKGSFLSDILFQSFGLVSLLIPFTFFFTGLSIAISKKFLLIIENSFFIIPRHPNYKSKNKVGGNNQDDIQGAVFDIDMDFTIKFGTLLNAFHEV